MIAALISVALAIPLYALIMLTLVAGTIVFWRRSK